MRHGHTLSTLTYTKSVADSPSSASVTRCAASSLRRGSGGLLEFPRGTFPSLSSLDSQVAAFSVTVAGFWGKVDGTKTATGDPGGISLFF